MYAINDCSNIRLKCIKLVDGEQDDGRVKLVDALAAMVELWLVV